MKTETNTAPLTATFAAATSIVRTLGAAWDRACASTDAVLEAHYSHVDEQGRNTLCTIAGREPQLFGLLGVAVAAELAAQDLFCNATSAAQRAELEATTGQQRLVD